MEQITFTEKRTIYAGDPDREFVVLSGGAERPLLVSRKGWCAWGSAEVPAEGQEREALEFLEDDQIEELLPSIAEGFKLPEVRDKIRGLFASAEEAPPF